METKQILESFASKLTEEIKQAIPKVTGKTADSVKERVYSTGFEISANASLVTLIDGRKPTSDSATEGNPNLNEIILQWIKDKGLQPKDGISIESLAFLISRSIHRKGTRLYQLGGGNNLFKSVLNDSKIDLLVAQLAENKSIEVSSSIIKEFK
jgi:hypothetical protein